MVGNGGNKTRVGRSKRSMRLPRVAIAGIIGCAMAIGATAASASVKYAPYAYCDGRTDVTVEIANNSDIFRTVRLTAMVLGREKVDLGAFDINPYEKALVPVCDLVQASRNPVSPTDSEGSISGRLARRDSSTKREHGSATKAPSWGNGSKRGSVWFSLSMDDEDEPGNTSELLAWAITTNEAASLRVDAVFRDYAGGSSILETQWWKPTDTTNAFIAFWFFFGAFAGGQVLQRAMGPALPGLILKHS